MEHVQETIITNYWFLKPFADGEYYHIRTQVSGSKQYYWRMGYKDTDGNVCLLDGNFHEIYSDKLEMEFQQELNKMIETNEDEINLLEVLSVRAYNLLRHIFINQKVVRISDVVNYLEINNFEMIGYMDRKTSRKKLVYRCIISHRHVGIQTYNEIMKYVEPFIIN